jgi:signal transduction histidine kinase
LDTRGRREGAGGHSGHDSAFVLPEYEPAGAYRGPLSSGFHAAEDSRVDMGTRDDVIAVVIDTIALRSPIVSALSSHGFVVAGPSMVPEAALVIAEAIPDLDGQLADLRRRARPDTAILMVLGSASGEAVAHAHKAGAFACLRAPLVHEELLGFVTSAQDSRAARVQAADLARKLDLEAHLASIGRISAGLSHEVSSPLGAASLNMDTVARESRRLVEALKWLAFSPAEELAHRLEITREHIGSFESPEGLAGAIEDTVAAHERLRTLFGTMRDLVGRTREVRREPIALLPLVHEIRKWLTQELKGVEVEVIGEPLLALGDRTLLGQLLHNLTSNAAHAAKSLSAPRIRLHVYSGGSRVIVSVRDNGPGIPLELQERIFEPFFTTRRGNGGTGLGLALCREYALQMRAELSVWSLPGRGACFRVSLPPSVSV